MTATLVYRLPVKTHSLDDGLKFAMRDKYFSEGSDWITIDQFTIPFLEGVAATTPHKKTEAAANKVIALIRKHDFIELCLEY